MKTQPIYLAVEDVLSEHIAKKIIDKYMKGYAPYPVGRKSGQSHILKKLSSYRKSAQKLPFLILVDLDRKECAALFKRELFGDKPLEKNLLFRVAVREIESWILADKSGFCSYFGVPKDKLSDNPDDLEDAKQFLINAVQKYCKDKVYKADIAPSKQSGAVVGPAYNSSLLQFIDSSWSLDKAQAISPSLKRCVRALRNFARRNNR